MAECDLILDHCPPLDLGRSEAGGGGGGSGRGELINSQTWSRPVVCNY